MKNDPMTEYAKTKIDNLITLKSIITVYHIDRRSRKAKNDVHNFPEIFYMLEGSGSVTIDGQAFFLEAGEMIIYAPNSVHGNGGGGIVEIISFETTSPLPDTLYNRVITLTGNQRMQFQYLFDQALPLFESRYATKGMFLKQGVDPYVLQSIKNKMELFLLDLLKPSVTHEMSIMTTITDYMVKNIHRVLTLSDISKDLGISESSLKKTIHKTYGKPPMAYFKELKIEEAKRLIATSPLNMTEISEYLGFSSVHHFSRMFHEKTGVSPTQYAKASRK